jgi:hypothetical protein
MRRYTKGVFLLLFIVLISLGVAHYLRPRIELFEDEVPEEPAENVEENAKNNVPVKLPAQYTPSGLNKVLNQMIVNAMQTLSPARRGQMGPQGVQGPPGLAGGVTVDNGNVLRNVGTLSVAERLAGTGNLAKVFLSAQNYFPQQTWSVDQSGQIRNHYGITQSCMAIDKTSNDIYMLPCVDSKVNIPLQQKWRKDGTGRLQSQRLASNGNSLCLEAKKLNLQANRVVGDTTTVLASSIERNYLTASQCDLNNANQVFSFY